MTKLDFHTLYWHTSDSVLWLCLRLIFWSVINKKNRITLRLMTPLVRVDRSMVYDRKNVIKKITCFSKKIIFVLEKKWSGSIWIFLTNSNKIFLKTNFPADSSVNNKNKKFLNLLRSITLTSKGMYLYFISSPLIELYFFNVSIHKFRSSEVINFRLPKASSVLLLFWAYIKNKHGKSSAEMACRIFAQKFSWKNFFFDSMGIFLLLLSNRKTKSELCRYPLFLSYF